RGACERRYPERRFIEPHSRIGEPAAVARRHLDIGEEVVTEGDGLCGLQVREARHHGRGMLKRLLRERALVGGERTIDRIDLVAYPELEVGSDLIVARARSMQPPGC